MKNWFKSLCVVAVMAGVNMTASAQELNTYDITKSKIERELRLQITSIAESPVPGLLQIVTSRGFFFTSTARSVRTTLIIFTRIVIFLQRRPPTRIKGRILILMLADMKK